MQGYIRKRKDFSIVPIEVLNYDICLFSIADTASSIIALYNSNVSKDDFVIYGEFQGVVKSVSVSGKCMTLNCGSMDSAFDRTLHYDFTNIDSYTMERLAAAIFTKEYKLCDQMYSMPYINIELSGSTELRTPNRNNEGLYTLSTYLAKIRKNGINVTYDLKGEELKITFGTYPHTAVNIDFTINNTVTSEAYGGSITAKVTNYVDGVANNYYLLSDGTVSREENDPNRVYGEWEVMSGADESNVLERFAITYGHSIQFIRKQQYGLYTPLMLKMPSGNIVRSYISDVRIKSNDSNYYYTAGEMKTTLTAKLKQ